MMLRGNYLPRPPAFAAIFGYGNLNLRARQSAALAEQSSHPALRPEEALQQQPRRIHVPIQTGPMQVHAGMAPVITKDRNARRGRRAHPETERVRVEKIFDSQS
jgi:hypothetical protein